MTIGAIGKSLEPQIADIVQRALTTITKARSPLTPSACRKRMIW